MSSFFQSIEGTEAGHIAALILALMAAVLHALFGVLQKGRHDPWVSRGVIDISYGLMAVPFALLVVPFPGPHMWPIFAVAWMIHISYKSLQARTYTKGAYTVVYPVVRGTGPFFAVIGAYLFFGEVFGPIQWVGVAVLLSGIFGLSAYNLRYFPIDRATMWPALMGAVLTGVTVALYTTWDAYGIRSTTDPFTFLAWFFMIDGLAGMWPIAVLRLMRQRGPLDVGALAARGLTGAFIAYFSFGAILMATRLDKVGEAAVLRETSTVFAALFGWLILKERIGPRRLALMGLIAAGAVLVEFGG